MNKIEYLFPKLKDDDYKRTITKKYNEYIKYSQLPLKYIDYDIDTRKLTTRLSILYKNFTNIVNEKLCLSFDVRDYSYIGFLSSLLLDKYFVDTINFDNIFRRILYIDTNLLMDDYKKLIDSSSADISLAHSMDTLYRDIEQAELVIWDKFSMINSTYDKQKLYNILLNRYRNDLGNIYFIKDGVTALSNICDMEMINVMNVENIISLQNDELHYEDKTQKGNIKW